MFDNFITQLRTTPRLRWGMAAIIAIGWLYGVLLLRDAAQDQSQQERAATQAISRLRAQLTQTEWPARVPPAKVMAVQLEGQLWQAATTGLAQAALQDWLTNTLAKSGIANAQVSITVIDEAAAGTPADLWKLKAKLGFEFNAPTLLDFLNRLDANEKQTVVALLNIRKEPSPRVDMELFGYFQKPAAAAAKPAKEQQPPL